MIKLCEWCEEGELFSEFHNAYWELPDGTRAVTITETPTFVCSKCKAAYQSEETIKEIEDQLFLVDRKAIPSIISYQELMNMKRLLKRNYFDFS
jgi:uncharacterized YokU family protein|nr:YokU family protein [Peribacillus tepidiphilus]